MVDVLNLILKEDRLPSVQEQADNLIRYLGERSKPSMVVHINHREEGAIIGSSCDGGLSIIIEGLIENGFANGESAGGAVCLTFRGWQRFEELGLGAPSGTNAFMAMKYGDTDLDNIVENFFRKAVAQTGFSLFQLDDKPRAGLIDDRMRVEIKNCRFLIADETHGNHGAYWEAGYAEGLHKPVIYTCEKSVFDDKESPNRPHFDTNHHLTVTWRLDRPEEAAERLKATIRATMPEARQQDMPD